MNIRAISHMILICFRYKDVERILPRDRAQDIIYLRIYELRNGWNLVLKNNIDKKKSKKLASETRGNKLNFISCVL